MRGCCSIGEQKPCRFAQPTLGPVAGNGVAKTLGRGKAEADLFEIRSSRPRPRGPTWSTKAGAIQRLPVAATARNSERRSRRTTLVVIAGFRSAMAWPL